MEIGIFIATIVVALATFGYILWEESRDRKIMNGLFFSRLEMANKVAGESAKHEALVLKAHNDNDLKARN